MAIITIISGSPSRQSRLYGLISAAERQLREAQHEVTVIQVTDLPASDLLLGNFNSERIKEALAHVAASDAVIVASPVYKASFSGILKTFLDLIPEKGLDGKQLLPLFIGGTPAHLLVIDYALKPVLSALGGRRFQQGVYAVDQSVKRLEDGGFELDANTAERLARAVDGLQEDLG
ncbi:NADPH-dependent FMN reductase [Paenibacillus ginsengarvi]|uniref:FMN reductase (NADPH) n=1 Tax=Paenibacillus ginsengarvi TaxID=400777 RepID=A0A3B0CSF8_9BACL|nr:NADPH-dependent FMN reductase [Paenibacillus ginsengarvi]RKN86259.1 FMN reductase (NADPH) [Paenibacillus ginsengarvi]